MTSISSNIGPTISPSIGEAAFPQDFIVRFNENDIQESGGLVTAWNNQGSSAFDLDVVLGTAANLKPHPNSAMLLYGASGDFASSPDSVAASVTGSAVFYGFIQPDDNTPSSRQVILAKFLPTGAQRSYVFSVDNVPTGNLEIILSSDGTGTNIIQSTAPTGIADGVGYWAFAVYDATSPDVTFYTSLSPSAATPAAAFISATQLGTVVAAAGSSIFDSTALFVVGSSDDGISDNFLGKIYQAGVIAGTDPSVTPNVAFNAADGDYKTGIMVDTFVSSATGETYTLNGNTFIQNTGQKVVNAIANVGIETTVGQLITTPMTIVVVGKAHKLTGIAQFFTAARSDSASEPLVYTNGLNFFAFNGGTADLSQGVGDLNLHLHTVRYNGDATTSYEVDGIGIVVGNAGAENLDFATLFAGVLLGNTMFGSICEYIIYPRALSNAEVLTVQTFLTNKWKL